MKKNLKKGLNFGLTSAVITTLGLIVGLDSSTGSREVVISGILIIALCDAMSDALGMHLSVEGEGNNNEKQIWQATLATFFSKLLFALSFLLPFIFLPLSLALLFALLWGALLLTFASYKIALERKEKYSRAIIEHLSVATLVVVASYFLGQIINYLL